MSYSKEFDQPKYQDLRDVIQRETNAASLKPLSFEIFKKDASEKFEAKHIKRIWKDTMRSQYGRNWRKHNNPVI